MSKGEYPCAMSYPEEGTNENYPFIEWRIRWIKKKTRAMRLDLPFAVIPKLVDVEVLYYNN